MMADMMQKKNYDLTEITRLLLEMRENCIPKAGNAYEDPNRVEKYDALNAAIDLINNPSMLAQWISVKERLPEVGKVVLAYTYYETFEFVKLTRHERTTFIGTRGCHDYWDVMDILYWMPLPEPPKEE